jgi:hypothetical protein
LTAVRAVFIISVAVTPCALGAQELSEHAARDGSFRAADLLGRCAVIRLIRESSIACQRK